MICISWVCVPSPALRLCFIIHFLPPPRPTLVSAPSCSSLINPHKTTSLPHSSMILFAQHLPPVFLQYISRFWMSLTTRHPLAHPMPLHLANNFQQASDVRWPNMSHYYSFPDHASFVTILFVSPYQLHLFQWCPLPLGVSLPHDPHFFSIRVWADKTDSGHHLSGKLLPRLAEVSRRISLHPTPPWRRLQSPRHPSLTTLDPALLHSHDTLYNAP